MSKGELGTVGVVVLIDDSVPVLESLEAHCKLLDVFVEFIIPGSIVRELEVLSTYGGGGRSEGGKGEGSHL